MVNLSKLENIQGSENYIKTKKVSTRQNIL